MGLRALTPVGEPSQYDYSPVGGLPTQREWDLITLQVLPSCCVMAYSLSSDVENLR